MIVGKMLSMKSLNKGKGDKLPALLCAIILLTALLLPAFAGQAPDHHKSVCPFCGGGTAGIKKSPPGVCSTGTLPFDG